MTIIMDDVSPTGYKDTETGLPYDPNNPNGTYTQDEYGVITQHTANVNGPTPASIAAKSGIGNAPVQEPAPIVEKPQEPSWYDKSTELSYGQLQGSVEQQAQSRKNQQQYIEALQAQMRGEGPSVAQLQLKQGQEAANRAAMSMAASQRGISPAMAAKMASRAQQQNIMQAGQQAAMLRAQEQLSAQQQLAAAIQAQRGGDLGTQQAWTQLYGTSGNLLGQNRQLSLAELSEANKVAYQNAQLQMQAKGQDIDLIKDAASAGAGVIKAIGSYADNTSDNSNSSSSNDSGYDYGEMNYAEGGEVGWSQEVDRGGYVEPKELIKPLKPFKSALEGIERYRLRSSEEPKEDTGDLIWNIGKNLMSNVPFIGTAMKIGTTLQDASAESDKSPEYEAPNNYDTSDNYYTDFEYASKGGQVPGKAKAKGDNYKNDTVPAMLSPGEIVLPRSVAQSDNAAEKAKAFVEEIKKSKKGKPDFESLMRYQSALNERLARLEKMLGGR